MLALIAVLALGAVDSDTSPLPNKIDLPTALQLFHQRGFDLLVADASVDTARGEMQSAGAVANPQLGGSWGKSFTYDSNSACGAGRSGCDDTAWTVSFTDPQALGDVIFGKRGLRVDAARAALDAAQQGRVDAQRNLDSMVKQQFLATVLADQTLEFATEAQGTFDHTADLFNIRYKAGAVSEADLARVETAALESQQQVDAARANVQQAHAMLAFFLGVRGATPEFILEDDWIDSNAPEALAQATLDKLLQTAKEHRPDLLAAARQKERAQASLDLSHRLRVPDLSWDVSYTQEGTGISAIQPPTLTIGVSLTLPLWYQYQGEITQAQADVTTQDITYNKTEAQVVSDVEQAFAAFTHSRSQVERMRTRLRARSARARDLVQIQYEKGAASLLDLLDAQRTYIAVNLEYFDDLSSYWGAVFQLQQAIAQESDS